MLRRDFNPADVNSFHLDLQAKRDKADVEGGTLASFDQDLTDVLKTFKGEMAWADTVGLQNIVEGLKRQEARMGSDFSFSNLLLDKADRANVGAEVDGESVFSADEIEFRLTNEALSSLPGLHDVLVGLKKGDEVTLVTYPLRDQSAHKGGLFIEVTKADGTVLKEAAFAGARGPVNVPNLPPAPAR